ncbi:MAG: DUF4198 domain-containing protein [Oxalicibacterium faecigallinarum]|uniref:DUF4198 domain-containing protein n=1 Tax=Oxalicibacterium faecigallinarum TaxID=573741 RepID=UPI002807E080|nr:DUF4198 domain-containing protein [Oxalicibacterium faecigallinarum]MDQ7968064.1 DUF4198 domain-containing protein [Oxalicibacterium faecigallinarum]
MKKMSILRTAAVALSLSMAVPMAAHAHRTWLLPSSTVLSGEAPYVTVDAAVSNEVFYFDHRPYSLDGLTITGPDGKTVDAENKATGKFRSVFDVKLAQPGTYRIGFATDMLFATYKQGTETKRWRGTAANFAKEVPADAKDVNVSLNQNRLETFVSAGKPTAIKPIGKGLELVPVTHPNDLFAGEAATFQFMADGKPAADIEVTVVPGGIRYRDQLNEIKVKTDKDGKFSVKWPTPGMYWLNAGTARGPSSEVGTLDKPVRRASYTATVEVLQP